MSIKARGFFRVRTVSLIAITAGLVVSLASAAGTLPDRLTDQEFWNLVSGFSEQDGYFPYENFLSNEVSYQQVIPRLVKLTKPRGAISGSRRSRTSPTSRRFVRRSPSSSTSAGA